MTTVVSYCNYIREIKLKLFSLSNTKSKIKYFLLVNGNSFTECHKCVKF